ncbi:hypothetical protein TELCIR_01818 [Teladorsagia circumcincta]|uniref:Uncharacterized protein n=1 Tax=Teladorsagia circumcincta TaxID=45464 RepID=A0A2G9V310_TELCI|nr:hypothetical protein TELCIR_01818 [Teladorsagia circumcincta]
MMSCPSDAWYRSVNFLHSIASDGTTPHKRARLRTFEASGFCALALRTILLSYVSQLFYTKQYHLQSNNFSTRQRFLLSVEITISSIPLFNICQYGYSISGELRVRSLPSVEITISSIPLFNICQYGNIIDITNIINTYSPSTPGNRVASGLFYRRGEPLFLHKIGASAGKKKIVDWRKKHDVSENKNDSNNSRSREGT